MINLEAMSFDEKVNLFKELVDDLDVTVTACYGEREMVRSSDVYIEHPTTVIIQTSIMTG